MNKTSGTKRRQVAYRPLAGLIPYARNSRTHSAEQIAQIANSIREFGWTNPILIDEAGGVIAGHGRLLAAESLGEKKVPCIVVDGLSDDQKRALVIADNKLAENAGWNEEILAAELAALLGVGFDMSLLGFEEDEMAELIAQLDRRPAGKSDEDDIPAAPRLPISKPGDVWILGRHRITCGDCTDAEAVARVDGAGCSLTLSDPPYGIGYEYESHDDRDNGANAELVAKAFANGPKAMAWTPGLPNLARYISRFGKAKVLCWRKGFAAAGNGVGGASTWEPILVVGKTPARKLANDVLEVKTDRLTVDGTNLRELHSCPKPVALYEQLAEAFTKAGGLIFEPFSGSGTTIIAAEKSGRSCRAVEIDPAYVDVAVIRWQEFTGETATLEATGEAFDALRAAQAEKKAA